MDAEDRANLVTLLARHADTATQSREKALATLIEEGFVDAQGHLTPAYGGGSERKASGKKRKK